MLYSDEIYIEDFKRTYTEAYRQGFIDGFNERGYLLTYIGNDHIENQNDHIVAEQTEPKPICELCSKNPCKKKEMINAIGHWVSECTEFDRKTETQKRCHRPSGVACHPEQGDEWCRNCDDWYADERKEQTEPQTERSSDA